MSLRKRGNLYSAEELCPDGQARAAHRRSSAARGGLRKRVPVSIPFELAIESPEAFTVFCGFRANGCWVAHRTHLLYELTGSLGWVESRVLL